MKSYIQDLCGDENPIDIDYAIWQCMLQVAIFEKLVGLPMSTGNFDKTHDVIWDFLRQSCGSDKEEYE